MTEYLRPIGECPRCAAITFPQDILDNLEDPVGRHPIRCIGCGLRGEFVVEEVGAHLEVDDVWFTGPERVS